MSTPNSDSTPQEQLSLDNCDKEPVHIPGHIQSFAVLIATDSKLQHITHCSENAEATFGKPPDDILGQPLSSLFDRHFLHDLNNTLCLSSAKLQRERVGSYKNGSDTYDVWAHIKDDIPILEIEKVGADDLSQSQSILRVRSLLTRLQRIDDLQKTLDDAVIGLRGFSGFDRVMLYQFDSNDDGEIKAESRSPHMTPFLGLRFPRWDIPNQARAIMKKLPLRMIANVTGKPVLLRAHNPNDPPLDLTFAASRGTSPIHCEYLTNMGVGSTMTLSVVVNDELWGLFAFHNEKPGHIDPKMRGAAELFAQFFSLQMEQRLERKRNIARSVALTHQASLLSAADQAQNIGDLIEDIAGPFCQLLEADGLAIVSAAGVARHGKTPPADAIKTIGEAFFRDTEETLIAKDTLQALKVDLGSSAGALALRLHDSVKDYVIFFREEAVQSVSWAGAPDKHIVDGEDGPRLKPRGSFAAYTQSIKGKSKPWEQDVLLSANEIRRALAKADAALFRRLSQKEERQRSIYIAELNHRVRNILALIRSISRRSKESSNSLETYARALEQRITALAAAHDLATNQVLSGVNIRTVFETEAKPYVSDTEQQLFISGESYLMKSDAAPIFALVVHELMTNCVKYGALSRAGGSLYISIERDTDRIKIHWKERGGPKIKTPEKRGFGLGLIEQAIPYELEGESHVEFEPDGLSVTLWFPEKITDPVPDAYAPQTHEALGQRPANIPASVLILEDSMMVALDTSDMLKNMGVETIQTCATVDQALASIQAAPPDFAVLDVSLRETTSFAVAKALKSIGIPFCFVTGFGSDLIIPDSLSAETVLTKPTNSEVLRGAMTKLYLQET